PVVSLAHVGASAAVAAADAVACSPDEGFRDKGVSAARTTKRSSGERTTPAHDWSRSVPIPRPSLVPPACFGGGDGPSAGYSGRIPDDRYRRSPWNLGIFTLRQPQPPARFRVQVINAAGATIWGPMRPIGFLEAAIDRHWRPVSDGDRHPCRKGKPWQRSSCGQ